MFLVVTRLNRIIFKYANYMVNTTAIISFVLAILDMTYILKIDLNYRVIITWPA